jgi:hypothetical protein
METTPATPEDGRPPPPVTPSVTSRWTGGRIVALVGGSLLALIALGLMACGAYGLWLHTTQRSDGYVMTSSERLDPPRAGFQPLPPQRQPDS